MGDFALLMAQNRSFWGFRETINIDKNWSTPLERESKVMFITMVKIPESSFITRSRFFFHFFFIFFFFPPLFLIKYSIFMVKILIFFLTPFLHFFFHLSPSLSSLLHPSCALFALVNHDLFLRLLGFIGLVLCRPPMPGEQRKNGRRPQGEATYPCVEPRKCCGWRRRARHPPLKRRRCRRHRW